MSHTILHILLVEDNPDHAELVRRHLEYFPVVTRLHHVEDGEAALDYVTGKGHFANREQFPWPALVLLDLRLPRMDGLEVLRSLKEQPATRALPVVVLTTSDAEQDVRRAQELRVDGFLTKPADFTTLDKMLGRLGLAGGPPAGGPPARMDSLQP